MATISDLGQLPVERLVDERVHGLGDTYYASERDAPCVGAVESAGGGDGDGAEQDGSCQRHESDVFAGNVLLEGLHDGGHNQAHESRCKRGCSGNIHRLLLR